MQATSSNNLRRARFKLPADRVRGLVGRRSNMRGAVQCAKHAGLIILAGALVALTPGAWAIVPMLLLGITLVSLFAPLHEASHQTVFRNRRANKVLAMIGGLVLCLPPIWFRHYHLAHHQHTQDPQRDPELATPKPATLAQYLWVISGLPYWASALRTLLALARGKTGAMPYLPARKRAAAMREARAFIAVYALAILCGVFLTTVALWYWLVPVLLGQPFLRLFLLAEHTGCSQSADGFTNTRTTLTSLPVRLLMWNMSFHAEHHLYPAVPFHALAELHHDVRARLQVIAPGYPAAHRDIRRRLRRP